MDGSESPGWLYPAASSRCRLGDAPFDLEGHGDEIANTQTPAARTRWTLFIFQVATKADVSHPLRMRGERGTVNDWMSCLSDVLID